MKGWVGSSVVGKRFRYPLGLWAQTTVQDHQIVICEQVYTYVVGQITAPSSLPGSGLAHVHLTGQEISH